MPFKSKAQMKAAFSGALGPEMQAKARQWADETPDPASLPYHAGGVVVTTQREKAANLRSSIKKLKGRKRRRVKI